MEPGRTVTVYTVDAVAILRATVDMQPPAVEKVIRRTERGIDSVEAPAVTAMEVMNAAEASEKAAGEMIEASPDRMIREWFVNGPVDVVPQTVRDVEIYNSLFELYTMHDAMLVASHRERDTEAILTNDEQIESYDETIW